MPNFLVMDRAEISAGAPARMFLYTNATLVQIGDTFGTQATKNTTSYATNDAIQFQGDLYGVTQDGVYKKDDPTSMTGAWTQQIAFTQATSTAVPIRSMGIHAMEVNGVMNLVTTWTVTTLTTSWRWAKFDGTTWTQAASSQIGQQATTVQDVIPYGGLLYCASSDGGATMYFGSYDPVSNSFAVITIVGLSGAQLYGSFCVFDGRLFILATVNGTLNASIFELGGGQFALAADTGVLRPGGNGQFGQWALFTDGTNMWAMSPTDNGGQGWRCTEFDTALSQTNRDAALPPELRWTGAIGGAFPAGLTRVQRMRAVYDVNTAVGTTDIYLYHAPLTASSFSMYKWNGGLSVMTPVDAGGNGYHSLPTGLAFGERIFTAGELDIKIAGRVGVLGGEQVSFIAYGGGTGRKMKLHHLLKGTPPLLPCTLALPVTGGSATFNAGLNQVEGIAADGVTVYTIVWTPAPDGLSAADRVIRVPEALV